MAVGIRQQTTTISIARAAREAGVHVNTVRRWIDGGHVAVVPTVYGRMVLMESLEEFLRNRAQEADKAIAIH